MAVLPTWARSVLRHLGRGAALLLVLVVGVLLWFAATIGAAALSPHPAWFVTAGLTILAVTLASGFWLTLRWLAAPRRRLIAGIAAAIVVIAGTISVLPPSRQIAAPPALPGQSYWLLSTGSRLAYVMRAGAGTPRATPIVVLHGGPGIPDLPGDSEYFGALSQLGYSVYVYAELGAGTSSRLSDPRGYTIDRDVADLEAIRQVIGARQMVLIGHSYGGALAAHYLAAHPDHVARMVLSSPGPLDPADRSTGNATNRLATGATVRSYLHALAPRALLGYTLLQVNPVAAHAFLPDPEADARNDTILSIAEPGLHCSPAQSRGPIRGSGFYALQYFQSATAAPQPDVRAKLSGLTIPTLIVKGSCDYLSWRSVLEYRRRLPASTLVYLPGVGHNTYQDRPRAVMASITAFLDDRPSDIPAYQGTAVPPDFAGPP